METFPKQSLFIPVQPYLLSEDFIAISKLPLELLSVSLHRLISIFIEHQLVDNLGLKGEEDYVPLSD